LPEINVHISNKKPIPKVELLERELIKIAEEAQLRFI